MNILRDIINSALQLQRPLIMHVCLNRASILVWFKRLKMQINEFIPYICFDTRKRNQTFWPLSRTDWNLHFDHHPADQGWAELNSVLPLWLTFEAAIHPSCDIGQNGLIAAHLKTGSFPPVKGLGSFPPKQGRASFMQSWPLSLWDVPVHHQVHWFGLPGY